MANILKTAASSVSDFFKGFTAEGKQEKMNLNQLIDFLNLNGVPKGKLSEATYFACLKILSESVGKLPLHLMQNEKDGGVRKAKEHPLYFTLKTRPNPFMTSSSFWAAVEFNRNHYGNAYVYISKVGNKPEDIKLWILENERVKIWWDDKKILSEVGEIWYIYQSPNGKNYKFSSAEIMHFKTAMSKDGINGISVSESLASTLQGAKKAQSLVNQMYETGFTAKAVVQYTGSLNEKSAKNFAEKIESFAMGKDEQVKTVIPIPLGTTFTPLNMKFSDAEFMSIRKHTALQIAAAFGIKPNQINDYEKASYASAEAQQLAFYVDTLLFILKQYEEEITYKLLTYEEAGKKGYHWKFNVAVILRADQKTQIETLGTAVQSFLYTPNEARAMLDKPAMPDGNRLMGNGSTIPLNMVGEQYKQGKEENRKGGLEKQKEKNKDDEGGEN